MSGEKLCDYGCGNVSAFVFKNGKHCCSLHYRSCPKMASDMGKKRIGKTHSKETKQKIGVKSKERMAIHNHFKGRSLTDEHKQKISERTKGRVSWAKGFTKDTHPGLLAAMLKRKELGTFIHYGVNNGMYGKTHTEEVKTALREKNKLSQKWEGENNPWYGKDRSGENSPRFLSGVERSAWLIYKKEVRMLTERVYKNNKHVINPNNLLRGMTNYHLDHIIPIWYGFKHNLSAALLSNIKNLRILWWQENLNRNKTTLHESEQMLLQELLTEI